MSERKKSKTRRGRQRRLMLILGGFVLISFGVSQVGHPATVVEEGLFLPEQITVPFDKARALRSIVRIKAHTYFAITVYNNPREAAAARATAQKTFLPEGITIWPLAMDRSFLERLRDDPGLQLLPVFYEVARAFETVTAYPQQQIVPLQGAGTGFFISPDGYFLTSYHVVQEEIEADGRTEGSDEPIPCRFLSFEVPIVERDQIVGFQPLKNVQMIRNVSLGESRAGLDAALFKADIETAAYLDLDPSGTSVDDPVWVLGFPIRTRRDAQRRTTLGYPDADGSLRISRGKVLEQVGPYTFTSTVDGFSGSSGAPTINKAGRVVGLVQEMYPEVEAERRAIVFAGGLRHVNSRSIAKSLELEAIGKNQSK